MLVVDDKSLTSVLDQAGYRKMGVYLKVSAGLSEAVRVLETEPFDVILLNWDSRRFDGATILKQLKRSKFKDVPIVASSVQSGQKVKDTAIENGASLFIEQPIPREFLIQKLKTLLDKSTRVDNRMSISGEAKVKSKGKELNATIVDVSMSGILILCDAKDYEAGDRVHITFKLDSDNAEFKAEGEFARTVDSPKWKGGSQVGLGFKFLNFKGDSQARLERILSFEKNKDIGLQYYL